MLYDFFNISLCLFNICYKKEGWSGHFQAEYHAAVCCWARFCDFADCGFVPLSFAALCGDCSADAVLHREKKKTSGNHQSEEIRRI